MLNWMPGGKVGLYIRSDPSLAKKDLCLILSLHFSQVARRLSYKMVKWKKYLIGEWSWTRPIKSFAFIYLAMLVVALGFSDLIIYQPPAAGYSENDPQIDTIETSGGIRIGIFHLPANPGMPTLLWSHGNAEDIGYLNGRFKSFHTRGYGILAYDYPGYGISKGKPNEDSCYEACQTAWNHLTVKLKIPPKQIIIYGQSVGSGPSVWLASREQTAGLMLVAPFVSAFRAVTRVPLFPGDRYNNIDRIPSIKTPLLVIHGEQDQVIGQWNGKKLYEFHTGSKEFHNIPDAGHNDIYILAGDQILDALDSFWSKQARHTRIP